MGNEKQTDPKEQDPKDGAPEHVGREEFQKVAALADALGANLRKEREASGKRVGELEASIKSLTEKMAGLEATKPPATDDKPDPRVAALEARLKEYEGKLESERRAREEVEQARLSQERRTALSNALVSKGISGPHLDGAMAYIYDAKKLVVHDEKGGVGIKMTRAGYEEVVPLDTALDELLKQDAYKIFVPPRAAGGSGTAPGKQAQAHRPDGKMTKEEAWAMLPALMRGQRTG
jgi:hypothetical protein